MDVKSPCGTCKTKMNTKIFKQTQRFRVLEPHFSSQNYKRLLKKAEEGKFEKSYKQIIDLIHQKVFLCISHKSKQT